MYRLCEPKVQWHRVDADKTQRCCCRPENRALNWAIGDCKCALKRGWIELNKGHKLVACLGESAADCFSRKEKFSSQARINAVYYGEMNAELFRERFQEQLPPRHPSPVCGMGTASCHCIMLVKPRSGVKGLELTHKERSSDLGRGLQGKCDQWKVDGK
jgi:hypothetical protein